MQYKVIISLCSKDSERVEFWSNDPRYIRNLNYHFTVKREAFGPFFQRPKVFFKIETRSLPLGLVYEAVKWSKKFFPKHKIKITKKVKEKLINEKFLKYDLALKGELWEHQERVIRKSLYYRRGLIEAYVSSGKTASFAKIIEILLKEGECSFPLIIVPLQQLVEQTAEELVRWTNFSSDEIGKVYANNSFDPSKHKIVISTWQSLNFVSGKLKQEKKKKVQLLVKYVDLLICDEVHTAKADVVHRIISSFKKCKYKLGFTGTIPKAQWEQYMLKAAFGPVLADVQPEELLKKKLITKPRIYNIFIDYKNKKFVNSVKYAEDYHEAKELLFENQFRLNLLSRLVRKCKRNVLILVNNVEVEGEVLKKYLQRKIKDRQIVFLSGKTSSVKERQKTVKEMEKRDDLVVIATYGIFKMGISVRNIHNLILASSVKSFITVRQSLGRGLRLKENKKELKVFNIIDSIGSFKYQGLERQRIFEDDGFESKVIKLTDESYFV